MKLLLTGDLHLGRTSTRMPEALKNEARAASAWARIVDLALERQVAGGPVEQRALSAVWYEERRIVASPQKAAPLQGLNPFLSLIPVISCPKRACKPMASGIEPKEFLPL